MLAREYNLIAKIGGNVEIDKNEKITMRIRDKSTPVLSVSVVDKENKPVDLTGFQIFFECIFENGKPIEDGNNFDIDKPNEGHFKYTISGRTKCSLSKVKRAYFRFKNEDKKLVESTDNFKFEIIGDIFDCDDNGQKFNQCYDYRFDKLDRNVNSIERDVNYNNKLVGDIKAAVESLGIDIGTGESVKSQIDELFVKADEAETFIGKILPQDCKALTWIKPDN